MDLWRLHEKLQTDICIAHGFQRVVQTEFNRSCLSRLCSQQAKEEERTGRNATLEAIGYRLNPLINFFISSYHSYANNTGSPEILSVASGG